MGQTERNLSKRYNEHLRSFRKICPTFNKNLKLSERDPYINNVERFCIHKETAFENKLTDKQTISPNKIFDVILNIGI
jgi:hypothetical protein